jgi:hypothetical protein
VDSDQVDRLAKHLVIAPTRRAAFGLAGALVLRGISPSDAKHKHKKKKPLVLNAFGCVDVGNACRGNDANCCSSNCEGKKPKRGKKDTSRCLAHNVLDCSTGTDTCLGGLVTCGVSGACFQTTGKASFCGGSNACSPCTTDADCELLQGPGAACVVCDASCGAGTNLCVAAAS